MNKTKPVVSIDNWYLIGGHLYGNVSQHPRFDDGTLVKTSKVVSEPGDEPATQGDQLETHNTFYVLGEQGVRDERNRG